MVFSRLCFCEKFRGGLAWIRRADLQTGFRRRDEENLVRHCDSVAVRFLIHRAGLRTCFRGRIEADRIEASVARSTSGARQDERACPGRDFEPTLAERTAACLLAIPGLDILRDLVLMADGWASDHVFDVRRDSPPAAKLLFSGRRFSKYLFAGGGGCA